MCGENVELEILLQIIPCAQCSKTNGRFPKTWKCETLCRVSLIGWGVSVPRSKKLLLQNKMLPSLIKHHNRYINVDPSVCKSVWLQIAQVVSIVSTKITPKLVSQASYKTFANPVCTGVATTDGDTEMCYMCTGCWIQTKYSV